MNDDPVIKLIDICKTYYTGKVSFKALKNINLEINYGEYAAILGPSGSGKSTLMQIIGCLLTPTSGDYILSGRNVSKLKRNELAKVRNHQIGFVFQSFNLLAQVSLLDNVALPLLYQGVSTSERHARAKVLLEKLGLGEHLNHLPNELSGGQQQRVAIARALVNDPEVILADEPTGNLDSKSGQDVVNLFEQFSLQGKTVILVTHDLKLAERAKRVIEIHDGEVR
ncbi:MAG: ABC transporter ATP-binding protein [Gammaproteobacteria bacterium]|jgi:putative ABC transport system ATP-binding protein